MNPQCEIDRLSELEMLDNRPIYASRLSCKTKVNKGSILALTKESAEKPNIPSDVDFSQKNCWLKEKQFWKEKLRKWKNLDGLHIAKWNLTYPDFYDLNILEKEIVRHEEVLQGKRLDSWFNAYQDHVHFHSAQRLLFFRMSKAIEKRLMAPLNKEAA